VQFLDHFLNDFLYKNVHFLYENLKIFSLKNLNDFPYDFLNDS